MRIFIFSALLICLSGVAAETGQSPNKEACSRFWGDLEAYRKCEKNPSQYIEAEKPVSTSSKNSFRVSKEEDIISRRTNVFASVSGKGAAFHLRCMDNTTAAYFHLYRGTTGVINGTSVTYRIDDAVLKRRFTSSDDGRAHGLWSGSKSIPFLKQLMGKSELAMRLPTYGGHQDALFDLAGIDDVIAEIRSECGW